MHKLKFTKNCKPKFVCDTEALVKNYQESLKPKNTVSPKSSNFEIEENDKNVFNTYFGNKVDVESGCQWEGKITIPFKSAEDFKRILEN
jgi:ParB family chromosome partitioning protein